MFRRWVLAACIAGIGVCIAFFFLDIKPASMLCSEGFALLAREQGDATENAEAAYNKFDRAVTLAPSCAVCYFGRGVSLYRQFYFWAKTNILDIEHPGLSEDIAQIIWDNLTKAIELDPNLAEAYFFRGLVTLNLLARSKSVDIDDFSAALSYDGAIADMERLVDSFDCAVANLLDRSYPDLDQDESLCEKGEELLAQWRAR